MREGAGFSVFEAVCTTGFAARAETYSRRVKP